MRLVALYLTHIKGFVRNWRSVVLLLALPLILISALFLSFNPSGLQTVSIGYVYEGDVSLDKAVIRNAFADFARLSEYGSFDDCAGQLAAYREYACIVARGTTPVTLTIHYDNTREPVIWEILERTKQTVAAIERSQSTGVASDFLTRFRNAEQRLITYDNQLQSTDAALEQAITTLQLRVNELSSERSNLDTTLTNLQNDIIQSRNDLSSARNDISAARTDALNAIYLVQNTISLIPSTNETASLRSSALTQAQQTANEVTEVTGDALDAINRAQTKLNDYEDALSRGRQTSARLTTLTNELTNAITSLRNYQTTIRSTRSELTAIRNDFAALKSVDASTLVEPVKIAQEPFYIPKTPTDVPDALKDTDGFSFILLQTMFPSMLVLVLLFLSLLIGAFVTLQQINSTAYLRIRLAQRTFLLDSVAIFLGALTIVTLPAVVVLVLGAMIFQLPIIATFGVVFPLVALFIATFVLAGMLLAYIFRSESITLMVSTFFLVFIVFLTGILLPIERMHPFVSLVSHISSSTIFLETFKQVIFHGTNGFWNSVIYDVPLIILLIQVFVISNVVLIVKKLREN